MPAGCKQILMWNLLAVASRWHWSFHVPDPEEMLNFMKSGWRIPDFHFCSPSNYFSRKTGSNPEFRAGIRGSVKPLLLVQDPSGSRFPLGRCQRKRAAKELTVDNCVDEEEEEFGRSRAGTSGDNIFWKSGRVWSGLISWRWGVLKKFC